MMKRQPLLEIFLKSDEDPHQPLTVSTDDEDMEKDSEYTLSETSFTQLTGREKWIICIKCPI